LDIRKGEVTQYWGKMYNKELHSLYSSPDISMMQSRKIIWTGYVACIGEMRNLYKFWTENLKARERLEGVGIIVWLI
jgi:hypothetical protein